MLNAKSLKELLDLEMTSTNTLNGQISDKFGQGRGFFPFGSTQTFEPDEGLVM